MKTIVKTMLGVLLFFTFSVIFPVDANAKKDPVDYHVIVTLKDGTTVDGYITTALRNYFRPRISEVGISSEFGGKPVKYTSDEVVSIVFPPSEKDTTTVIYHSVIAQSKMPNYLSKNPKAYKKPIFLRLVYNGNNVKGYAMPLLDRTFAQTMTVINYTWRYFYKTSDNEMAKAYWDDVDDIIPGMKKVMKFYFREFPEIQQMVDNEEITPRAFRDHPAMVLPIMDYLCAGKAGNDSE